jgi:AcrR family transcriptional regulator
MASRAPRRADAQRNYERILAAAETALNAHGANASLDEIAKAAGVGNATLYRHFPTRRSLIEAVYDKRIRMLCVKAGELAATREPGQALLDWLRVMVAHITDSRLLAEAFMAEYEGPDDAEPPLVVAWHRSIEQAVRPLLTAAEDVGAIRSDLGVAELMTLTTAVARAGDHVRAGHYLDVLLEGMVPRHRN